MSNGNQDPNTPPPPDDTRFGELANIRSTYGQEMANNPDLRRRLMAIASNEVGTDNDAAKQAFIETVFNRSASRKMSLEATLNSVKIPGTNKGYWDPATGAHTNDPVPQSVQDSLNPMIDRALAGSNVSGLSTGNQSPAPPSANFKLLPPRFDPQQKSHDTFVVEEKDQPWFNNMLKQQTRTIEQGQPVTPDVGPVNALKDVPAEPVAPRAQPVVQPVVRRAQPVAQTDTDSDGAIAQTDTDSDDATNYAGPGLGGSLGAVNA